MDRRLFLKRTTKALALAGVRPSTSLAARLVKESTPRAGDLVQYPDPPIPRSDDFSVTVNGVPVYVYNAGTFRGTSFAFSGTVRIEIMPKHKFHTFAINPISKGITATRKDNSIVFELTSPQKLEIQIDGASSQITDADKLLYLFGDAPETDAPSPEDKSILYLGPGKHSYPDGILEIKKGDPVAGIYLAPGCLLEAVLDISGKDDFKVWGRGFARNPRTDKKRNMFVVHDCRYMTVKDFHLYDSISHIMHFSCGNPEDAHDINVRNLKSMHYIVNSDGFTLNGQVNHVVMEDCFIIGNDNLVLFGGSVGAGKIGPSHNVVRNCTFIKSSYAGNWCFLQGNSPPNTGGAIGPGNVVVDCDIVRMNGELGLITEWWGTPTTISNIVFEKIRLQTFSGYAPDPQKSHVNMLLYLQSTDKEHKKEITLRDIHLPSLRPSEIADGNWVITFDRVYVAGKLVTKDSDLQITKGPSVMTHYWS
jgi:hypothetical protein